jgi:hypothetical protein
LRGLDGRLGHRARIGALVIEVARHRLRAQKPRCAVEFGACKPCIRNRCRKVRLRFRDGRLIGARIDDEKNVARVNLLPVVEPDFRDASADFGAYIGRIDRRHAAGKLRP